MSVRQTIGQAIPPSWRPHVLDALDRRGVVHGLRAWLPRANEFELADFTEAYPNAEELLVLTQFSVLSRGTERAMFRGETSWLDYPATLGYSQVGRVLAAGGHQGPQPGELVATTGPHASVVRVLADDAIRVPDGVPAEQAAFHNLAAIAFQSVRRLGLQRPTSVVVLGAGVLGHLTAHFAHLAGHDTTLVNRSADRLEAAADAPFASLTLTEASTRSTPAAAAVVIDLTGTPQGAIAAADLTSPGGMVVLAGSTRGPVLGAPAEEWRRKGLRFVGAHVQSLPPASGSDGWTLRREREAFIDLLAAGLLDVEPLVSARVRPGDIGGWYSAAHDDRREAVGVVVDWSSVPPPPDGVASPLRRVGDLARAVAKRPAPGRDLEARPDGRRVGFAIVGCGDIGIQNAKAIADSGAASVVAAADRRPELARGLAAANGAAAASDLEELLQDDSTTNAVDAVLIAAPHHLHRPLAFAAAAAGKHVVLEKPLALDASEGQEIIDACDRAGVRLTVCYTIIDNSLVRRARELLRGGIIGRVTSVEASWAQSRGAEYWTGGFSGRARDDWRTRRETAGGGVLIMNACHFLFGLDWLVESTVDEALATMGTLVQPVEVEDTVSVSMAFENGVIGRVFASTATDGPGLNELRVSGTHGTLEVLPNLRSWSSTGSMGAPAGKWKTWRPDHRGAERTAFFRATADALLDGTDFPVTAAAALAVQRTIDRCYQGDG